MAEVIDKNEQLISELKTANQKWFNDLLPALSDNDGFFEAQLASICQGFIDASNAQLELQDIFYQDQLKLWKDVWPINQRLISSTTSLTDQRFHDPDWQNNPFFEYIKCNYLNLCKELTTLIASLDWDKEAKFQMQFFLKQYLDAISPTNFVLTNPEVIKALIRTHGQSFVAGVYNWLHDLNRGYITMTDESKFAVGHNLAITRGAVIFRNELIELIQYSPNTAKVYQIPLLIVPPCINKYYILDLQPTNSLVKYLVDQGYTVFLISWKSADSTIKDFGWNEYVNIGVIRALEVVRQICQVKKVNTLGYCIGGTILTTAELVLKQRKLGWINSMIHLTTMLDHSNPGDIRAFINKDLYEVKPDLDKVAGIMSGRVIAQTFSLLRANDLIWNYWVNNYLLGKTPREFDILYWNNDVVDLPMRFHHFLIDKFYVKNALVDGQLSINDMIMDLGQIDCPIYVFAAQNDHIVPWRSAYQTTQYIRSNLRFVLGAAGHTAGVVNPPSGKPRNYWVNEQLPDDPQQWFEHAQSMAGSWWDDLNEWSSKLSGRKVSAMERLGSEQFSELCAAPGEYVYARAKSIIEEFDT